MLKKAEKSIRWSKPDIYRADNEGGLDAGFGEISKCWVEAGCQVHGKEVSGQ